MNDFFIDELDDLNKEIIVHKERIAVLEERKRKSIEYYFKKMEK
jgi:hypothetical protein